MVKSENLPSLKKLLAISAYSFACSKYSLGYYLWAAAWKSSFARLVAMSSVVRLRVTLGDVHACCASAKKDIRDVTARHDGKSVQMERATGD